MKKSLDRIAGRRRFFFASRLLAQTESKLAALEKLPVRTTTTSAGGAKSEGEAVIYANMDVAAMRPLTRIYETLSWGKGRQRSFSGAAIITRIDSKRAGKPLSDVV
jgi:hypothetical protein